MAVALEAGTFGLYISDNAVNWVRKQQPKGILTQHLNFTWNQIALSGNGNNLVAILRPAVTDAEMRDLIDEAGGDDLMNFYAVYTSRDKGDSWTFATLPDIRLHNGGTWSITIGFTLVNGITMTPDGTRVTLALYGKGIFTSINGGKSFTLSYSGPKDMYAAWRGVASSSDGKNLAAIYEYGVYTSTNYGLAWKAVPEGRFDIYSYIFHWIKIASSSDGKLLLALNAIFGITMSTDGGYSWQHEGSRTVSFNLDEGVRRTVNFTSVAMSASGEVQAVASQSQIYLSTDMGASWGRPNAFINWDLNWTSVAVSADGKRIAASVYGGNIYRSSDAGSTWFC